MKTKKKKHARKITKPNGAQDGTPFYRRPVFHFILIAALGLAVYSNTFHVPFVFDDIENIAVNPATKDFRYFLEPSMAEAIKGNIAYIFRTRYVGYLTFALNYKLGGLDVTGYHAFNLAIHVLNALLVYWLVRLTMRTPFLVQRAAGRSDDAMAALFAALLFVSHPLQTQAVTYVVQRFASLVAMFYLLSLVMYIKARTAEAGNRRWGYYAMSLFAAAIAMKTKENAFTLPFMVALYESMFFKGGMKKRALFLLPMALTLLIIPLGLLGVSSGKGGVTNTLASIASLEKAPISHGDYLLTQMRVITTYIRLLFFPVAQNIDYDYRIYGSLFSPPVFLSSFFLLSIFGLGGYLLYRSRNGDANLRLVSFGIFWFFIALLVESGAVPIADVIYEHRVYLPSVGPFIITSAVLSMVIGRCRSIKDPLVALLWVAVLVFSLAAYKRNAVWGSELSLWEDTVRKSPGKARPLLNLGNAYAAVGRRDGALDALKEAVRLDPRYAAAHTNLGNLYLETGRPEEALEEYREALRLKPDDALAHDDMGVALGSLGMFDEAIAHFKEAVRLDPACAIAYNDMGYTYYMMGMVDEAIESYEAALRIDPGNAEARENLRAARAP